MHHLILALGLALATVAFCHSARAACQCNCMWNEFSFNEMHQRNNSSLPLGQLSIFFLQILWLNSCDYHFIQRKSCNLCHCMILYHPIVLVARHGWILSFKYICGHFHFHLVVFFNKYFNIFSPGCILRAQTASPSHWWPVRCFLEEPEELTDLLWPTFAEPRPTFWGRPYIK